MSLCSRLLAIVLGAVVLAACGERPVTCSDYSTGSGSRPSLTTIPKPVNSRTWSKCSDGKSRAVTCTIGHLSAWKCTCSIDGVDKVLARRESDIEDERVAATATANQMCEWKVR